MLLVRLGLLGLDDGKLEVSTGTTPDLLDVNSAAVDAVFLRRAGLADPGRIVDEVGL